MKSSVIVLALALLASTTSLRADPATTGIVVSHPWLRATPKNAPVAGGYATVTNKGPVPDRLVGASLPMAPEGQVHTMTMTGGVMHMRRLDKGLEVAPGATVTLAPGGDHLMFLKPKRPLKAGDSVAGTLTFEKAGTIEVTFAVAGMAAKSAPGTAVPKDEMDGIDMHGMHMGH